MNSKFGFANVIITTREKNPETLKLNSFHGLPIRKIVLSSKEGLGYARNWGARKAGEGLHVFLDGDVKVDDKAWDLLLNVDKGTFAIMIHDETSWCSSRALSIWSQDFWKLDGFDENLKVIAEDADFFIRACIHGFRFTRVSSSLIHHQNHMPRYIASRKIAVLTNLEQGYLTLKLGWWYVKYQGGFTKFLRRRINHPRSFVIWVLGMVNSLWKKIKRDKKLHALAGFSSTALLFPLLGVIFSLLGTLALASAKEVWDFVDGESMEDVEFWDWIATLIGGAIALILIGGII